MRTILKQIALLLLFTTGCAHYNLPPDPLAVPPAMQHGVLAACRQIYPDNPRQFVHAIDITAPGGTKSALIGITNVFPAPRSIHCVLMSVEGLVLFEAIDHNELIIKKAIGPFQSTAFANAIMADITLTYFPARQGACRAGVTALASAWCRCRALETITDVIRQTNGNWQIDLYAPTGRRLRCIRGEYIHPPLSENFHPPDQLTVSAAGLTGYRLEMRLLSTDTLDKDTIE